MTEMTKYELMLATFVSAVRVMSGCDQDEATARIAALLVINQEKLGVTVVDQDAIIRNLKIANDNLAADIDRLSNELVEARRGHGD